MPQFEGPVPLLNLKANYESIKEEVDTAIQEVVSSSYYTSGPAVRLFESQFATFIGVNHCVGTSSGTHALIQALRLLGIGPGDEVVVQGNSFSTPATKTALSTVGASMVLVDHDDSFQLDLELLEVVITTQTKAVLVTHMYGSCCDMTQLVEICKARNIKLIEDCSQAHGATWRGKYLGSFGDIAAWSFNPYCNLGAYGEAGGLTTDDDELAECLRQSGKCFSSIGNNNVANDENSSNLLDYSLDAIHAAVLSVKLQYIQQWNRRRQEIARLYYELLCQVGDITFPTIVDGCHPAYQQFVMCTKRRDALVHWMQANFDIQVNVPPPSRIQQHEEGTSYSVLIPRSHESARYVLSLPMCPMLSDSVVMNIVTAIKSFFLRAEADYPPRPPKTDHHSTGIVV